ncbi:transcriptional regulator, HTH-type [Hyperthermus butylicus DSM 5456]|uniref:Transcriptional regulator, HTH-type n=2 Tax=Hyperthermus butylicus TaxID=54248 RepID=A2BKN6_HYPBU|nr:transcriptional regulator, HTH-type [Hyperthermus butylicus DSM 5456]
MIAKTSGRNGGSTASSQAAGGPEVVLGEGVLDDRDKAILHLLAREGVIGVSEIARRLALGKSVVWRKLQKLTAMGLVERVVVNGRPLYRLRPVEEPRN